MIKRYLKLSVEGKIDIRTRNGVGYGLGRDDLTASRKRKIDLTLLSAENLIKLLLDTCFTDLVGGVVNGLVKLFGVVEVFGFFLAHAAGVTDDMREIKSIVVLPGGYLLDLDSEKRSRVLFYRGDRLFINVRTDRELGVLRI